MIKQKKFFKLKKKEDLIKHTNRVLNSTTKKKGKLELVNTQK